MSEANKRARIEYLQSIYRAKDAESQRYRTALESIAANTCCDRCQEAALVAQAALNPRADAENATPPEQKAECGPNSEFDSRDGGLKCNHWPGQIRCGICGMGSALSSHHQQGE
jgi:hypothetical protein